MLFLKNTSSFSIPNIPIEFELFMISSEFCQKCRSPFSFKRLPNFSFFARLLSDFKEKSLAQKADCATLLSSGVVLICELVESFQEYISEEAVASFITLAKCLLSQPAMVLSFKVIKLISPSFLKVCVGSKFLLR